MKIYFLSSVSGASDAIGVIEERTKGMKLGEIWNKYGVQIIAEAWRGGRFYEIYRGNG